MKACAAFERWQPAIDSPVGVSQYAVGPSASTRAESPFVLPAQRPASPEIAESPSVTTVGVPTPGPSAAAGAATASTAVPANRTDRRPALIDLLLLHDLRDRPILCRRAGGCQALTPCRAMWDGRVPCPRPSTPTSRAST